MVLVSYHVNLPTHMLAYLYAFQSQPDKALILIKWWHQTMYPEGKTEQNDGAYFAGVITDAHLI